MAGRGRMGMLGLDPLIAIGALPLVVIAAAAIMLGWPRRVTHHYEVFVAAPPKTVWDTYLVHIDKADFRPGTRLLEAEVVGENPLTVRVRLQHDIARDPADMVLTYDSYEPYRRYRLRVGDSFLTEEGEFQAVTGGTRLIVTVRGPMRGFVLPAISRRRVERNHQALKRFCEGRRPPQNA